MSHLPRRIALLLVVVLVGATTVGCNERPRPGASGSGGGGKGAVRLRIIDQLGVGQVRETASITVGGTTQTIHLDETHPSGSVEFVGPGPGQYQASFQNTVWFYHQGGLISVTAKGQGTIQCQGNSEFELVMDTTTNPATLFLRPR